MDRRQGAPATMGHSIRNWVRAAWAALVLACVAHGARAQTAGSDLQPTPVEQQYCYRDACYPTLAQAEQALEAANPPYTPWVQKDVILGTPTPTGVPATLVYEAADTPPVQVNAPVYSFDAFGGNGEVCPGSGDPVFPTLCRSEAEVVQGVVASYQRAHGGRVEYDIVGEYVAPFAYASPGRDEYGFLSHQNERDMAKQRKLRLRIYNDAGAQAWGFEHYLFKFTSFACRSGYDPKPGRHPSYDPTTPAPLTAPLCDAPVADEAITTDTSLQCNSGAPTTTRATPPPATRRASRWTASSAAWPSRAATTRCGRRR